MNLSWLLLFYILGHSLNGLLLKWVALSETSTSATLFYRGLGCVLAAWMASRVHGRSLWPKDLRFQSFRLLVAGVSMGLLIHSYQFVSATTVSMIMRSDVALLVLVSFVFFKRDFDSVSGVSSLMAFVTVVFIALYARPQHESIQGYGFAFLGTMGITLGYLIMKKSSDKENDEVVSGWAGLALIVVGVLTGGWQRLFVPMGVLVGMLTSGVLMFAIYQMTLELYRRMGVVEAEFPTLFSTILLLPLEVVMFRKPFSFHFALALVLQVVLLGFILLRKMRIQRLKGWVDER